MSAKLIKSLWNAAKSALIAASIWTLGFSALLWYFSKPSIPYFNFISVLAPWALAFFGVTAVIFELFSQVNRSPTV